jgi:hypothetical protein
LQAAQGGDDLAFEVSFIRDSHAVRVHRIANAWQCGFHIQSTGRKE